VEFALGAEQKEFRDSARRFLAQRVRVRELIDLTGAHDPALWSAMAEMGWMGVDVPEGLGGQGQSFLDLCLVLEEVGRVLLPGPFLATAGWGVSALLACGSDEQRDRCLPSITSGEKIYAASTADGLKLTRNRLRGDLLIECASVAHSLLVHAQTADGPAVFIVLPSEAELEPVEAADLTRPASRVRFSGAKPQERLPGKIEPFLARARVALAAEMVGAADRCVEMSVAYAKERVQFDRPIGSFQAVKHRAADMMRSVAGARLAAYAAAWAIGAGSAEAERAASVAKATAGDALMQCAAGAIQIHGGIGFTWESDAHLFYRRAIASQTALGSASRHRDRLAQQLLG
jgi:alkylation response protein AidB-like acyl-CoA dehydrogenase